MKLTVKTILLILVVFLLGTNVAIIITYRHHLSSELKISEIRDDIPDSQMGTFFIEKLDLNIQQQERFREFRRNYNRSANTTLWKMQEIRGNMAKALNSTKPDREYLDRLASQLGENHRQLKGLTFDYYINMQSVLDSGQQKKMAELFQAMLTDEGDAKRPVPGQGKRGQGFHHNRSGNVEMNTDTDEFFEKYN